MSQYESFWTDPQSVPIIWLGLLFSIMCLALLASDAIDSESGRETTDHNQMLQIGLYRLRVVQCLILGEYTNAGPHVLETLHNYVYIEFIMRPDAYKDTWILLGICVGMARRMGYHRDPSHFPHLTPLQSEMRRRMWSTVLLGDILISGQMGMPCLVSNLEYDTAEPRNLNDADLDLDITEIPASRPETEVTTTLGLIARRRLLTVLNSISTLTASVTSHDYAEIMRIDASLNEAEASIPQPLKMKSMAASVMDTAQTILSRLFIRHLYYKGQIMLHRRYLFLKQQQQQRTSSSSPSSSNSPVISSLSSSAEEAAEAEAATTGDNDDPYAYSRQVCIDASLGSLELQDLLDRETCPGGQLHTMRWRVSSIMNHQFLTATMILCSLLHRQQRQTRERAEEISAALRKTRMIWMRRSDVSREAEKAAQTVSIVLARAGESRGAIFDDAAAAAADGGEGVVGQELLVAQELNLAGGRPPLFGPLVGEHEMIATEAEYASLFSMDISDGKGISNLDFFNMHER